MSTSLISDSAERELDQITTAGDFCKKWKTIWRCVAVALEALLKKIFPLGAKVLSWLIKIMDAICDDKNAGKTVSAVMNEIK